MTSENAAMYVRICSSNSIIIYVLNSLSGSLEVKLAAASSLGTLSEKAAYAIYVSKAWLIPLELFTTCEGTTYRGLHADA